MLYHRDLPGGGYVAIQVDQRNAAKPVARVVVERRSDRARRDGQCVDRARPDDHRPRRL